MAEWFKAAVLKTVERKFRGFESYSLRHSFKEGEFAHDARCFLIYVRTLLPNLRCIFLIS